MQAMTDKRDTRPLVREGAPQKKKDRISQIVLNIWL
jgi:hypothetical protein